MEEKARAVYRKNGTWGPRFYSVKYALCNDGKRRTAYITGDADTFFSTPARVKVAGKTVSGFVCNAGYDDMHFVANGRGKNADLL